MTDRIPSYLPTKFKRIHLELTNRCNFSCVFCPDGVMTRPRGVMEEELARSALNQIAQLDLAEKVTFHVMGEPLLHPRFFQILDFAKELSLPVGLTTNGALLSSETIDKLARQDLHQVDISLQTPDAASFLATRGTRIDFDNYRARLLDLLAACEARPSPPIFKIRIMTTRFAGKMREQLGIPDFMGDADTLRKTILEWTDLIYKRLNRTPVDRAKLQNKISRIGIHAWNVIEISPNIFIETYVLTDWGNALSQERIVEAGHGYCFGMRDHFAILYSGDVVLCCVDFDGKTSVGNIKNTSLLEILKSPELEKIMRGFRTGKLVHAHCRLCLGSATRASSWIKPAASFMGLKILKPLFYRKHKLFD
ncbi:MAG: radical SAM protein [Desulfomonile tiedjei]|nr:radical SAM protein [Desulfomonile tiedjei]